VATLMDLWRFVLAVAKRAALVLTGTLITLGLVLWPHVAAWVWPNAPPEIPDRPFWALAAVCFLWAVFLAWRDEHRKVAPPATDAADIRVGDKARELLNQLAPSFEHWPNGPQTPGELVSWAHKLYWTFAKTKPGVAEIVTMRPDASHHVRQLVGTVRDHFDPAAGIVDRVYWKTYQPIGFPDPPAPLTDATVSLLREAAAHMRQCRVALEALTRDD